YAITHASLHDGFPGNSGANEITGGSPAYARKAVTKNAAASRALTFTANPVFDVASGVTVRWWGGWTASTAGTCLAYGPVGGTPFEFICDLTAETVIAPAHGLSNGQMIVFYGGTVPGGLTEGTIYYVISAATDNFQVSATSGGSAINLTAQAAATVLCSRIIPEAFGSQGTFTLQSLTIAINK
ncbi:MAG TPA: hypothetical protein DCO82_10140, partial [Alphaproteobacteria bacterium]|nr:hypothetical protein [Alphaproteobacteria bacterium]